MERLHLFYKIDFYCLKVVHTRLTIVIGRYTANHQDIVARQYLSSYFLMSLTQGYLSSWSWPCSWLDYMVGGAKRCYADGFRWIALNSTPPKQERENIGVGGGGLVWSGCRWGKVWEDVVRRGHQSAEWEHENEGVSSHEICLLMWIFPIEQCRKKNQAPEGHIFDCGVLQRWRCVCVCVTTIVKLL